MGDHLWSSALFLLKKKGVSLLNWTDQFLCDTPGYTDYSYLFGIFTVTIILQNGISQRVL